MNVSFVNYDPFEQPVLVLKTAHGDTIGVIGSAENVGIDINYNEVSTIEFDITDRINGEAMPYYDQAVGMRIIELVDIGQFILMNPDEVDIGELRRKKCKCNSLEYEFTYKKITLPQNTYRLWDPSGKEITVVSMIMEQMPSWRVEFVSESLRYAYRTFSVSNDNLYNFIKGTVQQSFGCVFEFDTFNRTVRIIDVNADAETRPVLISHENLAKEIDIKENTDNLFTRLDVNGADGVDIRSVNPAGTNKLINLDYFMTKDNFSTALINKYNQWKQSWKNNITPYRYLTIRHSAAVMQKITEQSALLDLKNELTDVENEQAVTIQAIASGLKTQADLDDVNVRVRSKIEEIAAKENEIKNIEMQIEDIISEMKAVQNQCSFEAHFTADEMAILTPYIRDGEISESSFVVTDNTSYTSTGSGKWADDLSVSITGSVTKMTDSSSGSEIYDIRGGRISIGSNVTGSIVSAIADIKSDGSAIMSIRIGAGSVDGDTFDGASITVVGSLYSNTNDAVQNDDTGDYEISEIEFVIRDAYEYITLDVSEYDKRSVSQDLMEYGIDVLERLAWPKYSFSVSLANFFAIKDFVYFKNQLRLGAKIDLVAGEGKALSPICTGISMNYNNPSSLTMRFGDTYSANDSKFSLLDLLEKSVSMGKNVDVGKFNYSSFVNSGAKTNIKKFMESALDVAKNTILSSGRQAITWDGAGFRLRKWANDDKTAYDDEQIWMNNNSIMLTDDNWNTAKMAIGKFKDANLGDCWGVVAPMMVGTLIAGSELVIESAKKDGGTSVFRMDSDGCRLYNSQLDVHNETAHIAINPNIGIAVGKQSVYKDGDPTKLDENNANFWVDADGNVHMRGTLHGANGEFTGRVIATELLIQSGGDRSQTLGDYISEKLPAFDTGTLNIGGRNLLLLSKNLDANTENPILGWSSGEYQSLSFGADGFAQIDWLVSGLTEDSESSLRSPLFRLPDGWQRREMVLSAWVKSKAWTALDGALEAGLYLTNGDRSDSPYRARLSLLKANGAAGADLKSAAPDSGQWERIWAKIDLQEIVNGPIVITKQPECVVASMGDTVRFTVEAEGDGLTYQWQYMPVNSTKWTDWVSESAVTSSFMLKMSTDTRLTASYRCRITDEDGNEIYSDNVRVFSGSLIAITKQPENVTVPVGTQISFKVEAQGEGLTYQWEYMPATMTTWSNNTMDGNATTNLTFAARSYHDGYKYRCRITDASGNTLRTREVTLNIGEDVRDMTHGWIGWFVKRNADFSIKAPQLEFGSMPTDWNPAPEDADQSIANVYSELSVSTGAIAARVQALEDRPVEVVRDIASVDVWFIQTDSATEAPDINVAGWQTTAPVWQDGKYIWTKTVTTYTSGTPITSSTNPVNITSIGKEGEPGQPGQPGQPGAPGKDGRGVKSIQEQYYKSTSDKERVGGSWLEKCPEYEQGYYIWTRIKVTYTDDTPDDDTDNPVTFTDPIIDPALSSVEKLRTYTAAELKVRDNAINARV